MKKLYHSLFLFAAALLSTAAFAGQIGPVQVGHIDVEPSVVMVELAGAPLVCTGGSDHAYIYSTDANFKTFVAALLMARSSGASFYLTTTLNSGQCRITAMTVV